MGISVLYVRISSLDGKTDRQRVNEEEFDRVIEDKCSGSIPIFEREGGCQHYFGSLGVEIVSEINKTPRPKNDFLQGPCKGVK